MSQENMKVVRNACEAWARGDFEMSYASWHPDIEWDTTRATARYAHRQLHRPSAGPRSRGAGGVVASANPPNPYAQRPAALNGLAVRHRPTEYVADRRSEVPSSVPWGGGAVQSRCSRDPDRSGSERSVAVRT